MLEGISVKISVKNRVANPDEFSTFGRDTLSPQRGRARCNLSVGRGIAPSSTCAGWFANELNLTKGNSFTGALSIVVIQRHGRDLWTLISVEDRRIVSTNGRVRQTNCAISRGSLLPTPIFLLPSLLLSVVSFVFRGRGALFHPFFVFLPIVHLPSPSNGRTERPIFPIESGSSGRPIVRFAPDLVLRDSRDLSRDVVFATNRKNPVCALHIGFSIAPRKYRRIGILGGKEWANVVKRRSSKRTTNYRHD